MSATRVDLTSENKCAIDKGASWAIILDIAAPDNTPYPLQDYIGRCQIRKTAKTSDEAILAEPVVSFPDAPGGKLKLSLTASATDKIPTTGASFIEPSKYVYDVEIEDINNPENVLRIVEGFIYVIPGVTRS